MNNKDVRCTNQLNCSLRGQCLLSSDTPSTMLTEWVSPNEMGFNVKCPLFQPKYETISNCSLGWKKK